jgi:hypothetical protein
MPRLPRLVKAMAFYALVAFLVSAAFAGTLWVQYRNRPRAYLLVWAIALVCYAIAALTEVIGAAGGWSPLLYRTYYFFGAIILVGVLALGTIYLIAPKYRSLALTILVVLGVIGLVGVLGANLQVAKLDTHQVPNADTIRAQGGPFNVLAILLAIIVNTVGSVILIGGAAWSAYAAWRRGGASSRILAMALIAAGAFIVAGASSLTRLFHVYEVFYVGQAIGVLVMFAGFLTTQRAPRTAPKLEPLASP